MIQVLGVDLSLSSTGLVSLPENWVSQAGLDWSGVNCGTVGGGETMPKGEAERLDRLDAVSARICDFVHANGVTHVCFEAHAFHQGHQVYSRGELAGFVKLKLRLGFGLPIESFQASSARKTLLGKCPRKGAKNAVLAHCRLIGVPWKDVKVTHGYGDLCDAFCVANHYLGLLGFPCAAMEAA